MLRHSLRITLLLLMTVLLVFTHRLSASTPAELKGFVDSKILQIVLPDWFVDVSIAPDMQEYLANAKAAGKKGLIVNYETNGCSYCQLFIDTTLQESDIVATIQQNYDMLGFEMFRDDEMVDFEGNTVPVKDFVKSQGVQYTPTSIFYDLSGNRLFKAAGYYDPGRFRMALDYVLGGHSKKVSFRDWSLAQQTVSRQPAKLAGDPMFEKPPHLLARNAFPADRPLMVLFERGDCAACEEWHRDVFSDARIRGIAGEFSIVQLDMNDAASKLVKPDGKPSTPAAWAEELQLSYAPSIVLFDEHGNMRQLIDFPVLHNRFERSMTYMTEQAYARGYTYQRWTREKTAERLQKEAAQQQAN